MANRKKCPYCEKITDNNKKGQNAKGNQKFLCTVCKKGWTEGVTPMGGPKKTAPKKAAPKKTTPKKTAAKKAAVKDDKNQTKSDSGVKETIIKVNNSALKPKKGDLSVGDAFTMAQESFLELKKESHTVTIKDGVKTIAFKISVGRKG